MKKLILILTVLTSVFTGALCVRAETAEPAVKEAEVELYQCGGFPEERVELASLSTEAEDQLAELILRALEACSPSLDISNLAIPSDDAGRIFQNVVNDNPQLFYVMSTVRISYNPSTDVAVSLSFRYIDKTPEEIEAMKEKLNDETDKIISLFTTEMSSLDKALLIHDYLVTRCEYDFSVYEGNENVARNIYDFLIDNKGVCQAYALTYSYLMRLAGVECKIVSSDAMNHAWNEVCIDGSWYHVDATYDDPNINGLGDFIGFCAHDSFLRSDAGIRTTGHHDWAAPYPCPSSDFEDAFWTDHETAFACLDGQWYMAENHTIFAVDIYDGTKRQIYAPSISFSDIGWTFTENNFNVASMDGRLFCNLPSSIITLDPVTGETVTVAETKGTAVGLTAYNGIIRYRTSNDYFTDKGDIYELEYVAPEPPAPSVFAILDASLSGGILSAEITLADGYTGEVKALAAAYSSENELIAAKSLSVGVNQAELPEAERYMIFLWNDGLEPLCESVSPTIAAYEVSE